MIIDANCHWLWHLRRDVIEVSTWHAAEYYIYIFSSPLTSYICQSIKKVKYWSSKAKTYASYLSVDQEEEKTARLCLRLFRNLCTQNGYLLRFYEETSDSEAILELPQQCQNSGKSVVGARWLEDAFEMHLVTQDILRLQAKGYCIGYLLGLLTNQWKGGKQYLGDSRFVWRKEL